MNRPENIQLPDHVGAYFEHLTDFRGEAKYKNFIMFKTMMGRELLIDGKLEFDFDRRIYGLSKIRNRRCLVIVNKEFVKAQLAPADSLTFSTVLFEPVGPELKFKFSHFVTSLEVYVEIFDSEVKQLVSYDDQQRTVVFQEAMLSFARRYNELVKGNDFLKPMVYNYGPQIYAIFTNFANKKDVAQIAPSFLAKRKYKKDLFRTTKTSDSAHVPWRYYFYKAVDCFDVCEYLDSIVWGAISIETYVMALVKDNDLEVVLRKFIEGKDGNKKRYTFFDEIKILKDEGIIDTVQHKKLRRLFSKIGPCRNGIVHGDIGSTFYDKEKAEMTMGLLFDYYKTYCADSI